MVQTALVWENPQANRELLEQKLDELAEPTDLVVLPEMFTTAFSMESAKLAETLDGPTVRWMRDMAQRKQAAIVGSLIILDNGQYFNRLVWAKPGGGISTYDKRHLFRMADEHQHYSDGKARLVETLAGWRVAPFVCYDLRFPVWTRNRGDYDLALYVANWPQVRRDPWSKLLLARAIENQCYVVGVNRVGTDHKGLAYSGDSVVVDPKGMPISQTLPHQERVETVELDAKALADFRVAFPVGLDADQFDIRI